MITAFYWATIQNKPKVLSARKLDENTVEKYVRFTVPYIPIILPILLFCRHTELKLKLQKFHDVGDISMIELWNNLMEEKLLVRHAANDIKIIGKIVDRIDVII